MKKNQKIIGLTAIVLVFILSTLYSFRAPTLNPVDFSKYVSNPVNGLIQEKQIGALKIEAQYKPIEFIIAQEEKKATIDQRIFNDRKSSLEGAHYLRLRLKNMEGKDDPVRATSPTLKEYQQKMYYLSSLMKKDFYLLEGLDTIRCVGYQLAPTYNLTASLDIALSFERKQPIGQEDLQLIWEDKAFGAGKVSIQFDQKSLAAIPNFKTN